MEPDKVDAHERAMRHMKRSTELLRESVQVHEAEMAGLIPVEEARPAALSLNAEAIAESEEAIKAVEEFLDHP